MKDVLCVSFSPFINRSTWQTPTSQKQESQYCSLSRFWFLWWDMLNNWRNYGLPFLVTWKHFFPSWPLNSTGIQYKPLSSKVVCNHSQRPFAISPAKGGRVQRSDQITMKLLFYLAAVQEACFIMQWLDYSSYICLYICSHPDVSCTW